MNTINAIEICENVKEKSEANVRHKSWINVAL